MKIKKNTLLLILLILIIPLFILLLISFYSRFFYFDNVNPEINQVNIKTNNIIQLEILNGCGEDGLANKSRIYMRNRGFDVVSVANYDTIANVSFVINRKGDIESSKMVAKAFGISDSLIKTVIDSSLSLDCSLIIGKDYKKLKPFIIGE